MRRWLVLILLALLPLQFSWAAVAGYCQHETTPSEAAHFGHHEHHHHAGGGTTGTTPDTDVHADDAEKSPLGIDSDCAFCHLGALQAFTSPVPMAHASAPALMIALQPSLHGSHIPDLPERPDRRIA